MSWSHFEKTWKNPLVYRATRVNSTKLAWHMISSQIIMLLYSTKEWEEQWFNNMMYSIIQRNKIWRNKCSRKIWILKCTKYYLRNCRIIKSMERYFHAYESEDRIVKIVIQVKAVYKYNVIHIKTALACFKKWENLVFRLLKDLS